MKLGCILPCKRTPAKLRATLSVSFLTLTFTSGLFAQRLPSSVLPEHYALTLTPDLKVATFTGVETIDVRVAEPVNSITLNSAEIAFQSVTVKAEGKVQTATVSLDTEKEQATFTFPEKIPAGNATISIDFTGILNNELRGFYLSKTATPQLRSYAVRAHGRSPRLPII